MPRARSPKKKPGALHAKAKKPEELDALQSFIDHGGQISIGAIPPLECVAIAADEHGMIVALQRQRDETLPKLIDRLNEALDHCLRNETFIDEINAR